MTKFLTLNQGWPLIFKDLGLDVTRTLRRAGLADNLFSKLPRQIHPDDFYRLVDCMEQEMGEKELSIELSKTLRPEVFSPPIFTAICSENLIVAAKRLSEYKPLIGPMDLRVDFDEAYLFLTIIHRMDHEVPPSINLFELMFWVYIARYCTREPIKPLRIELPQLPANLAAYEEFLGCELIEKPNPRIIFSRADAEIRFLTRNDLTWAMFEPEIQRQLHELQADASISEQIRSVLFEAIPSGQANMDYVARRMALSPRSLQRRLKEENSSFKQVLASMRYELAKSYLSDEQISLSEASFMLGYQDTSSFSRAFKTWTGETPDAFRAHARTTH